MVGWKKKVGELPEGCSVNKKRWVTQKRWVTLGLVPDT